MNLIIVFLGIVFVCLIGFSFIVNFSLLRGFSLPAKISYSFGLGLFFVSYQLLLYSRFSIPWNVVSLLVPWFLYILWVFITFGKNVKLNLKTSHKVKKIHILLLILMFITFAYSSFEAVIRPPVAWDSWATWLVQSKIFFTDGMINTEIFSLYNYYYPLTIPLSIAFFYELIGKVDDSSVLLVYSAYFLFISLLFFETLKRRFGFKYALFFTFFLVVIQNFVRHAGRLEAGIADLPLGYFLFCSVTFLLEFIKEKGSKGILSMLSLFIGIVSVIKLEGLMLAFIIALIACWYIYKFKKYNLIFIIGLWPIPYLDWQIFRFLNNVNPHFYAGSPLLITVEKTLNSLIGILKELVNIKSWNLLWLTYFYSLLLSSRRNVEVNILNLILLIQLAIYFIIYILSTDYGPESSIERLLIHIAPIALLSIAIQGYRILSGIKSPYLNILKKLV